MHLNILDVVVHAFNPRLRRQGQATLYVFKASLVYIESLGWTRLYIETLLKNK